MERETFSLRNWCGHREIFGYLEESIFYWQMSFDDFISATLSHDYRIFEDADDTCYSLKEFVFEILSPVLDHDETQVVSGCKVEETKK